MNIFHPNLARKARLITLVQSDPFLPG